MSTGEKVIGICVARIQDMEQERQVKAICHHAKEEGYGVIIYSIFDKLTVINRFAKGEMAILDNIHMESLSALVILSEAIRNDDIVQRIVKQANKYKLPVVSITRKFEGCYNVLLDYESSFEKIVRHVVEHHKCKVVNFMAGFKNNEFSDIRIDIFRKVMQENGLEIDENRIGYGDFWEKPSRRQCEEWVESGMELPEAIICANDIMAITVCNVLTNHGIRVPEDIIVTGFDGIELGSYCTPRITTARDDVDQIGKYTMEMINKSQSPDSATPYDVLVKFYVRYAASCGCEEDVPYNPNELIMQLYGRGAEIRVKTGDFFIMMNDLTDGESMALMTEKLKKYRHLFDVKGFKIFVNRHFLKGTDLAVEGRRGRQKYILLAEADETNVNIPMYAVDDDAHIMDMVSQNKYVLMIPLHWQNEVYGYMIIAYDIEHVDYSEYYEFIMCLEQVLGTIRKQSQLHDMYVRDALTRLYNRFGFYSALESKMKKHRQHRKWIFLVSLDLDRLKYINDNFGHAEGDVAIRAIASIIDSCKGKGGVSSRFGGDEFMIFRILDEDEMKENIVRNFEKKINYKIECYNRDSGKEYNIGASIGMVIREIHSTEDMDTIMKEADNAMYICKENHHKSIVYEADGKVGTFRS